MKPQTLVEWLAYAEALHPAEIDMGLERMHTMLDRLELVRPAPGVITVAGTNGKGSTTVAAEAALLEAGLTVGSTLSPHVHRFNERVRVNGLELGDSALAHHFETVDQARDGLPLTYFEFAALVALQAFRDARVDVCVLEIGLGGRLDAFNAIDADVAVVTSIGLDHTAMLGNDRETIGAEKAGIFRQNQRVVLGPDMPDSVNRAAARHRCDVWRVGDEIRVESRGAALALTIPGIESIMVQRPLLAPGNVALGLAAAVRLANVPREALARAGGRAYLPGRMETFEYAGRTVVVDVAHNPDAARFLARNLATRYGERPLTAVVGSLSDKDLAGVAAALDGVSRWVATRTEGTRGQSAAETARKLPSGASIVEQFDAALAHAIENTDQQDVILVFGSFYVVEKARETLAAVSGASPASATGR